MMLRYFLLALALTSTSAFAEVTEDIAPPEFVKWSTSSMERARLVSDFHRFLEKQNVVDVVPYWQLLIPDAQYADQQCPIDTFIIPPRELWSNVLPTLRFLREKVEPKVGQVRIVSGFRSPAFNACIGGAKKSAHMSFSAFDMIPVNPSPVEPMFQTLCALWKNTKADAKFGLGAYFDPTTPEANPDGRFHVDTIGQRTWGFDYTYRTSYCLRK